jgi:Glucose / Sorbosone dehydrogenase
MKNQPRIIMSRAALHSAAILFAGCASLAAWAQYPSAPQITRDGTTVVIEDYASLPFSSLRMNGVYPAAIDYRGQLGKSNVLVSEPRDAPRSAARLFVVGQNGVLYVLDRKTREFKTYIDFGKVFGRFNTDPNLGMGLVSMQFDPAYAKNGKFYVVHTESPAIPAPEQPSNAGAPGIKLDGYATTPAIDVPAGETRFHGIVTEWTDTNIGNDTFEGTVREIIRIGTNYARHPVGDLLFNPTARPGHADYGNLYISVGDGEAGERAGVTHTIPQRLDALPGKILRITPDLSLRPNDMTSANGRYRIPSNAPDANPFVSVPNARAEIFAYGLRNPHRIQWDAASNVLLVADIGNHSWEEVNVVTKGANFGWPQREGPEQTFIGGPNGGRTGSRVDPPIPLPNPDTITVDGLDQPVTPIYPIAAYSHHDGIAIGSIYVYRGKLMPQLIGKVVFSDIASGRMFYADLAEMLAMRATPRKLARIHELQILYRDPNDKSAQEPRRRRMFDIVADAYVRKGGIRSGNCVLPDGSSNAKGVITCGNRGQGKDPDGVPWGGGRADVRLAVDGDGELYLMSKADGMIRKMIAAGVAGSK